MALLNVPIHLQDDPDTCGEACAQMVVRTIVQRLVDQDVFDAIQDGADRGWATAPMQLCAMINSQLPGDMPPFSPRLTKGTAAGRQQAMDYVHAAVTRARVPVVALFYGNLDGQSHWSVVRGITSPAAGAVIHFRDPIPVRDAGAPPHADADDCPTADAVTSGQMDEWVTCHAWAKSKFRPSTSVPGHESLRRFVVVGPPVDVVANAYRCPARIVARAARPIEPNRLPALIERGLDEFGLRELPEWEFTPRLSAEQARLVWSLADEEEAYYLAAIRDDRRIVGVAQVDAFTGELHAARQGLPQRYLRRLFEEPESGIPGAQRLVWQAHPASFQSPYFPLAQMDAGQTRFRRVYDQREVTLTRGLP